MRFRKTFRGHEGSLRPHRNHRNPKRSYLFLTPPSSTSFLERYHWGGLRGSWTVGTRAGCGMMGIVTKQIGIDCGWGHHIYIDIQTMTWHNCGRLILVSTLVLVSGLVLVIPWWGRIVGKRRWWYRFFIPMHGISLEEKTKIVVWLNFTFIKVLTL